MTTSPQLRHRPWLLLAGTTASVALAYAAALAYPDRPRTVALGALAAMSAILALFFLVGARYGSTWGLSRWKLGPWSLLWCSVAFGAASTTWRYPQEDVLSQQIDVDAVIRALPMVVLALVVWSFAYECGLPARAQSALRAPVVALTRVRAPQVRSLATPWLLYGIAIASRLVSVVVDGRLEYLGDAQSAAASHSGYEQFLVQLDVFGSLAVAAASLQVFQEGRRGARVTLAVIVALEFVYGAFAGFKENFLILVLAVIVPYTARRARFPIGLLVVAAVVYLSVIVPFNAQYRDALQSDSGGTGVGNAVTVAPKIFASTVGQWGLATLTESSDSSLARVREIDNVAIVLQRTPNEVPYAGVGELLSSPLLGVVPRAVWPDKPVLDTGLQFSRTYYLYPDDVYTSTAPTPPGDLLRHGGVVVMVIGMFAFGLIVRIFDDVFDVRSNPHATFFVISFFSPFIKFETGFVTLIAGIPFSLITATAACWLCFAPARAGRNTAAAPSAVERAERVEVAS